MDIFPEFPPGRLSDPKRRAESQIYDQLARSTVPGHALYEAKPSRRAAQIDYAIWLERGREDCAPVQGRKLPDRTRRVAPATPRGLAAPGLPGRSHLGFGDGHAGGHRAPAGAGVPTSSRCCCSPTWSTTP